MPYTITAASLRKLKSFRWDNEHSRVLQKLTGDPKLVVAYDGSEQAWMLARLVQAQVVEKRGQSAPPSVETVAQPWAWWTSELFEEEGPRRPLAITDPRLVPYIQACDTWNNRAHVEEAIEKDDRDEKSKERAINNDLEDRAAELLPLFRKYRDEVSGSSRWGKQAPRKFYYEGCLKR